MSFPEVLICQACGRASDARAVGADDWLVSSHRYRHGTFIIRCPQHISEWAMRHTLEGRTKEARDKASRGRQVPIPPLAGLEPVPGRFRGADGHAD